MWYRSYLYQGYERVYERHRHRYEVNPGYVNKLAEAGLVFSGQDDTGERMEIVEISLNDHPFYFGTQFHPEFQSRPFRLSPPFVGFIQASSKQFKMQTGSSSVASTPITKFSGKSLGSGGKPVWAKNTDALQMKEFAEAMPSTNGAKSSTDGKHSSLGYKVGA
jgi:hypothetical protein